MAEAGLCLAQLCRVADRKSGAARGAGAAPAGRRRRAAARPAGRTALTSSHFTRRRGAISRGGAAGRRGRPRPLRQGRRGDAAPRGASGGCRRAGLGPARSGSRGPRSPGGCNRSGLGAAVWGERCPAGGSPLPLGEGCLARPGAARPGWAAGPAWLPACQQVAGAV